MHGIELPPGVLSDQCGEVTDIVHPKQFRTLLNIDCPFVVDLSTFTDDNTTMYTPSIVYTG